MDDLDASALPMLPERPADSHKGSFGTVAIVGGCAATPRMIGAPALAARAALRAGAGLVRLVCPEPILDAAIGLEPSATGIPLIADAAGAIDASAAAAVLDEAIASCDVLAIGPGLGSAADALVLRAAGQDTVPIVVDADGLNALARTRSFHLDLRASMILTPHPGEFARLAASLGLEADARDHQHRPAAAASLAQRLGCVVVLKGASTVVSDGQRTWVCGFGHPCLATAGTGDVLTGLIASLVGQVAVSGSSDPALGLYDIARIGVQVHAQAGERWAREAGVEAGLLARELADLLHAQLQPLRA